MLKVLRVSACIKFNFFFYISILNYSKNNQLTKQTMKKNAVFLLIVQMMLIVLITLAFVKGVMKEMGLKNVIRMVSVLYFITKT